MKSLDEDKKSTSSRLGKTYRTISKNGFNVSLQRLQFNYFNIIDRTIG